LLEAGISSSYHIAKFFGLTEPIHKMKATGVEIDRQRSPLRLQNKPVTHAAGGILNISATINDALKAAGLIR
jgi:hypothetical protein